MVALARPAVHVDQWSRPSPSIASSTKHGIADRLSLVKIDIEGAEPIALRSGLRLFDPDRLPLFIVEVQGGSLANFGFKPLDVLQFFPGELFELFQRSRSDLTPRFEHGRLIHGPINYPKFSVAWRGVLAEGAGVATEVDRRDWCGKCPCASPLVMQESPYTQDLSEAWKERAMKTSLAKFAVAARCSARCWA
jgi:hypothetical protein